MNTEEQAAFYKEMAARGLCMFPIPDTMETMKGKGLHFLVRKVWTPTDDRLHLENTDEMKGFSDEEAAIDFVKEYIGWRWDKPVEPAAAEEEQEAELQVYRCEAHMMINIGFGPQDIPLGQMTSTCQDEDWHVQLQEEAKRRAETYLIAEYPDRDLDSIEREIKVRPLSAT